MKKVFAMFGMTMLVFMLLAYGGVGSSTVLAKGATINIFISSPEYADAMNKLITQYKKVKPDVTINYETTQSDYPTLLKVKLNSGNVPDIFSSTSGKEIELYKQYSLDLSDQAMMKTMLPSVKNAMVDANGKGVYGFAIKGNYFGLIYNKALFQKAGISSFPETTAELETAVQKLEDKGIRPFTSGFAEWWVYKHVFQHFLAATTDNVQALSRKFAAGEAQIKDYPEIYNNFFNFVDLVKEHGSGKPLESDLSAEIADFASGTAAMMIGQGAWVEDNIKQIDPNIKIGFIGYPVSSDPAQEQVITGPDQALRVYKDSDNLQAVLDFVNWWYTSDYGASWFTDVAGVVPPIKVDRESKYQIIRQGQKLVEEKGAAPLGIIYSTDAFWNAFGEAMQAYVGGVKDKDATCATIEQKWHEIDGSNN